MRLVVVTGASRGLGAALAERFVRRGDEVVAVARDEARLADLARRLGPACRPLSADLSTGDGRAALLDAAPSCDVAVLNAGVGLHGPLAGQPWEAVRSMVDLNVGSVIHLAHHYVGAMRRRGAGRVLMVASSVAERGAPQLAAYAASKAFVLTLGRGLAAELHGSGVTVSCLVPGPLATEFAARAGMPARLVARGDDVGTVATAALDGLERGEPVIVPGVRRRIERRLKSALPEPVWAALARRHHSGGEP